MDNVLGALRHMAEHGGSWYGDTFAGFWCLYLSYVRSDSDADVGFTKDELRAFLEHYEDLISENEKLKHCIKLLNEHYEELTNG